MAVNKTDVAIPGAGPTGLMAALSAARSKTTARIFENRPGVVTGDYADGLFHRTVEILDSFGLPEKLTRGENSAPFNDENWWLPDKAGEICWKPTVSYPEELFGCKFHGLGVSLMSYQHYLTDALFDQHGRRVDRGGKLVELDVQEDEQSLPRGARLRPA